MSGGPKLKPLPYPNAGGSKHGRLLRLAADDEFEVLVTMDRRMDYQQNRSGIDLCLVLLSAVSYDTDDLLPLVPGIDAALREAAPGRILRVAS